VPVSIVDAAPGPERESSRATTIHAGTLDALDHHDRLGEEVAAAAALASKSHLWSGERRIATVHWDRMRTRYAAMFNLPQADLEAIIRRRLESLGVGVQWNRKMTHPSELDASFIVGCDGAHSAMRKSIGLDLVGATLDERFLLADVKLTGDVDDRSTNIWVSTGGVLGVLPIPNGLFRLNGTLIEDEAVSTESLPRTLSQRMGVARRRFRVDEVLWAAEYHTHSRLATSYRRANVFIAGDAAHLNSPVGGQGMNVGIGDALELGARLGEVHRGRPLDILDGYEARRRPVAERVITTTEKATAMLTARRPVERLVRNQLMRLLHHLPPVQQRLSTETAFISQSRTPEG
jgi:4,5-epoxidase